VTAASLYAGPSSSRIVLWSALATIALHGLVIWLLTVNWSGVEREVTRVKPAPMVIEARLVDASEFRPQPAPKAAPRPAPPKPAVKEPAPPRPAAPKPAAPKPAATKPATSRPAASKPAPAARAEPKSAPQQAQAAQPRFSRETLAAGARADLARALAAEAQSEALATADEMAASYAALIRQSVVNYWSRPPSARNGMEALLAIQLIPTGEVVSVSVLRSSGNTAFDRSAVNAVEKAGSFPELRNLPPGEFEKTFRRFHLLFRPEDLRY
jgi:TonB family protein